MVNGYEKKYEMTLCLCPRTVLPIYSFSLYDIGQNNSRATKCWSFFPPDIKILGWIIKYKSIKSC